MHVLHAALLQLTEPLPAAHLCLQHLPLGETPTLAPWVQKAKAAGQLYVVAAANNAIDMDVEPQYPGEYLCMHGHECQASMCGHAERAL